MDNMDYDKVKKHLWYCGFLAYLQKHNRTDHYPAITYAIDRTGIDYWVASSACLAGWDAARRVLRLINKAGGTDGSQ